MFGLVIMTKARLNNLLWQANMDAYSKAVEDISEILQQKEKVHLEPITLHGEGHTITNCAFLRSGIRLMPEQTVQE